MASHSSTLAWKIPWMEEPGRLQSMGSLRVGHDWATSLSLSCIRERNGNISNLLAWKIPGMEEPGRLQSMGSQRVRHDWVTSLSFCGSFWRRKWQLTPVFLPGKSHGWKNLVGYSPWGCKESGHDWATSLSFFLSFFIRHIPISYFWVSTPVYSHSEVSHLHLNWDW